MKSKRGDFIMKTPCLWTRGGRKRVENKESEKENN